MLLGQKTAFAFLVFSFDALTLWLTMRGFGVTLQPWVAFVSFMMASAVATLAPIPLGLGTFAAACVGMLHLFGISIEVAFAATLLLRGLTFWLPMLPGLYLARRELRQN